MLRRASEALLLASLVWAAPSWADDHGSAPPTVSVVGVATEDARPDIAVVVLDVLDDRPNANDAATENARISTAVIDGLKGSGIDARDITTVGLSLAPVVTDQRDPKTNLIVKSVPNGFHASNVVRVRVRQIDRTGAFIAAAVQNGAFYQGLSFDLSDREAREDALRVKAAANAMHRATLYAEGASMKLGALRSLGADAGSFQPMGAVRALAAVPGGMPIPVEPGLISLHETVNATWEMTAPEPHRRDDLAAVYDGSDSWHHGGMDLAAFRASLDEPAPPPGLGLAIEALWRDGKGDWEAAHDLAQRDERGSAPGCTPTSIARKATPATPVIGIDAPASRSREDRSTKNGRRSPAPCCSYFRRSASTPGRTLPSIHSRKAPPAVDT